MEYQKNQVIETYIEDMSDNGEGIGKVDGYTLFIKDTVIGDQIRAKITKVKKKYGYGRVMEIIKPSPDRVEPRCGISSKCGGCTLQAMSYETQLRFKEKKVREHLVRIGGFPEELIAGKLEPIIGAENPFRYRNKAQFPVGHDNNQEIISGFYVSRSHEIVDSSDCYLGIYENKIIVDILLKHFNEHNIKPYDETTGKGLIRHIMIRKGFATGEVMICLIINSRNHKQGSQFVNAQEELIDELKKVKGVKSICVNLNSENTNVILGKETYTVWGSDTIRDTLMGLSFEISPASFYQVNPAQTEKLYCLIREFAGLSGGEEVWDICCGIGTIALMLACKAGKVHGIEIVPEAIENAKKNAKINNIENAEFICAPAEEILPRLFKGAYDPEISCIDSVDMKADIKGDARADLVVMDPPRKGMDIRSLDAVIKACPEKVIYVSCDSATLARDLKRLCVNGYEICRIRPVDMFPQTVHVETVCLLSKLSSAKHHIEINVDMDELDLTSAEAKATYKEIEEWVRNKYGFHVTNLNIAQVKQKHGIIERENYNKPKSPDSKQPGCPEEKVKAIEDAMRHFQMIE